MSPAAGLGASRTAQSTRDGNRMLGVFHVYVVAVPCPAPGFECRFRASRRSNQRRWRPPRWLDRAGVSPSRTSVRFRGCFPLRFFFKAVRLGRLPPPPLTPSLTFGSNESMVSEAWRSTARVVTIISSWYRCRPCAMPAGGGEQCGMYRSSVRALQGC